MLHAENFVIAVEHDLSILDYLSDYICVLYGHAGVFGVVTMPYSVRDDSLTFRVVESDAEKEKIASEEKHTKKPNNYVYPEMVKTLDKFRLTVQPGSF